MVGAFFNSYYKNYFDIEKISLKSKLNNDDNSSINIIRSKINLEERNVASKLNVEASSDNPGVKHSYNTCIIRNTAGKGNDNNKYRNLKQNSFELTGMRIDDIVAVKIQKENIKTLKFDNYSFLDKLVQFKCFLFSAKQNEKLEKLAKYRKKFDEKLSLENIVKFQRK